MAGKLRLDTIDKKMLTEALFALSSEAMLQGILHATKGSDIDNDAICERITEVLVMFEAEMRSLEATRG